MVLVSNKKKKAKSWEGVKRYVGLVGGLEGGRDGYE